MALKLTAVPARWIQTESDRKAVESGCRWSQAAVDHVLRFAATLRNPMDAERPYVLQPWQEDLTVRLFGWRRPDGRRRFTRLNLWLPKKNGKTSFLAFLALVFLLADGEKRPGCYVTGTTGEQADELFTEALNMTAGTTWRKALAIQNFRHRMRCWLNNGVFGALTSSADAAQGLKGSFVCLDEIHALLAKRPKLYGSLRYAGAGRRQSLTATISTAGDDRQGLPYQIYARAKRILAGEITDPHTLCAVWEAADQDDYADAELAAANPGIGHVLELSQLRDDWEEAKTAEFSKEDFKRYRLNVWTKRSTSWLAVGKWNACRAEQPPELTGRDCYLGIDLSGTLDLTAAVAVFPLGDDRFFVLPHFFLPAAGIADRCLHEMDYQAAAAGGFLTLCPGPTVNYDDVAAWVERLAAAHTVRQIGFDPWKAAELAKRLGEAGFDCVAVKQGWTVSEPMKKLESLIATGNIGHDGNPILSWCVENIEVRTDGQGKVRPVKPIEKRKRIDGIIGVVNGLYLAMFAEQNTFVCG